MQINTVSDPRKGLRHFFGALLAALSVTFFAACAASQTKGSGGAIPPPNPKNAEKPSAFVGMILKQLVSPDEAKRFRALKKAEAASENITAQAVNDVLTALSEKNLSTLVFFLMEQKSDVLYNISPTAYMALENSGTAFPNLAYYYARIRPEKGLICLIRLYEEQPARRLPVCKAIGEIGTPAALNFMLTEIRLKKKQGKDIYSLLAGLKSSGRIVEKNEIRWLLNRKLDREEFMILSQLRTEFTQEELVDFFQKSPEERAYAVQYVFSNPGENFESLKRIVGREYERGNYSTVLQWMLSDSMRKIANKDIRDYREEMIKKSRDNMSILRDPTKNQ